MKKDRRGKWRGRNWTPQQYEICGKQGTERRARAPAQRARKGIRSLRRLRPAGCSHRRRNSKGGAPGCKFLPAASKKSRQARKGPHPSGTVSRHRESSCPAAAAAILGFHVDERAESRTGIALLN